jgi:hypothetical protein
VNGRRYAAYKMLRQAASAYCRPETLSQQS